MAATAPVATIPARWAALELLLGLAFGARYFGARRLIHDLHGEAHLAAVIEAQEA